ncbi:MAG: complex I subunit 5 family protein [Alkalispirochaetaceae bacterium]
MPRVDPITLTIVTPLAGAAAAFLTGAFGTGRLAGKLLALSLVVSGGIVLYLYPGLRESKGLALVVGGWAPSVGIELYLDGLAWVLLLTLFLVSFAILLSALGDGVYGGIFYAVYGIAVAGMAGVILSADLFNLFVFFEVLSLAATILIAYKRQLTGLYSAYRYLLITALSVTLYLLGLFILYRATGELRFAAVLPENLPRNGAYPHVLTLAGVLLFVGVAIRAALVPFHTWLPDAHSQAPHPVSALLSGLVIKAAFIALWRMVGIFSADPRFMGLLTGVGLLSALFGVVLALVQRDAKRLLAYHSISQMGYIAVAAGTGAMTGAVYHIVGHALFKSLLFLIVGYYITAVGSRDLYKMGGSGRCARGGVGVVPVALFLVGAGAIAGLPPFVGFVSKGLIGAGVKGPLSYWGLKAVSVGTAASFIKLGWFMLPAGRSGASLSSGKGRRRFKGFSAAPFIGMGFLALLIIALGVLPGQFLGVMEGAGVTGEGERFYSVGTLYSGRHFLEVAVTLLVGSALFAILRTEPGRWLTTRVSEFRLGVDGALAVTALGLLAGVGTFVL